MNKDLDQHKQITLMVSTDTDTLKPNIGYG